MCENWTTTALTLTETLVPNKITIALDQYNTPPSDDSPRKSKTVEMVMINED